MGKIETSAERRKLAVRREPHWHRIASGKHLGFRKTNNGGHWIARLTHRGERRYQSLGEEGDLEFDAAIEAAMKWFSKALGPSPSNITINDVMGWYLAYLGKHKSRTTYVTDRARYTNYVQPALGSKRVVDLTTDDYRRFQSRLYDLFLGRYENPDDDESRRLAAYATNQVFKVLRAALNRAHASHRELPRDEWTYCRQLKNGKPGRREVFLDAAECQRLINACQGNFRDLVLAGLLTGARLGELVQAQVRDYQDGIWHVRKSKTKAHDCVLTRDAIDLFERLCVGKRKTDLIFGRADGVAWHHMNIRNRMKDAVERAQLDPETVFYTLRHSAISAWVKAGVPMQAVAENCGTSILMLERTYAKFRPSDKRAWLERGKIDLDVPSDEKVVAIR